MKVTIAKDAGYCFGVRDAVDLAYESADKYGNVYMLGDIVHNEQVVEDLNKFPNTFPHRGLLIFCVPLRFPRQPDLATCKLLFVESNRSLSELGDHLWEPNFDKN